MRIGMDFDGVGYDFVADAADLFSPLLDRPSLELIEAATEWDFPTQWGVPMTEFWAVIYEGVAAGDVWLRRPPEPGFVDALEAMRKMGHTIHIGTSRRGAELNTIQWIIDFGIPHDSISITKDKTILDVDLFFEDAEKNWEALLEADIPCVLFDRPWNRHLVDADRVRSWPEAVTFVEALGG